MSSIPEQQTITEAIQKALEHQKGLPITSPFFFHTNVMGISSEVSSNISNVRFAKKLLTLQTRTLQKKDGTECISSIRLYVLNKNENAAWILTCADKTTIEKKNQLWNFSEDVEDDVKPISSDPAPPFPPARDVISKLQGLVPGKRPSIESINPYVERIVLLEQEVDSLKNEMASLRDEFARLKGECIKMMF